MSEQKRTCCVHMQYELTMQEKPDMYEPLRRIYQVIIANEQLLNEVCEYTFIQGHAMEIQDTRDNYIRKRYGEDLRFFDLILSMADHFSAQDKEWLQDLAEKDAKERQWRGTHEEMIDREDAFDIYLQVEDLESCFSVVCTGYAFHNEV